MHIRISSRKSDLARLQVYRVVEELKKAFSEIRVELNFRESLGDKNLTDPLWKLPEKGVFTEDFYKDLLDGKTDAVVHSWKDLPTEGKPETEIVATLKRADQRDLFLFKKTSLEKLSVGKQLVVYSSSPRRAYNLEPFFQDHLPHQPQNIEFRSVRGNIQTRVKKLFESEETDGLIVAKAAIDRLLEAGDPDLQETKNLIREHLSKCVWMVLPLSQNPCAAAQGAIAVEILKTNELARSLFSKINHIDDYQCAAEERKILAAYGGGCHQKIGVTVQQKSYGRVTFLKGLTDTGLILNEKNFRTTRKHPKFKANEIFSSSVLNTCFERRQVDVKIPECDAYLVAKADAWPQNFSKASSQIIWSAGLETWKALAKQGLWVNGTQDGLGEKEATHIETLAGKPLHWMKLSHEDSKADSLYKTVGTYKLVQIKALPDLTPYKCFFWTSGYFFIKAVEKYPEIINSHHSCGPGNTYDVIMKTLTGAKLDKNIGVFIDQESWRNDVLS